MRSNVLVFVMVTKETKWIDAITVSLTGLDSLVVRSSLTAGRFGGDQIDLRAVASEANVDAVVTGSLLHAGGQLRVSVQLIEAASGTVLWSHALQAPLDDLFSIQDSICSQVVAALAVPLSNNDQRRLRRDVPVNAEAYASGPLAIFMPKPKRRERRLISASRSG